MYAGNLFFSFHRTCIVCKVGGVAWFLARNRRIKILKMSKSDKKTAIELATAIGLAIGFSMMIVGMVLTLQILFGNG